MALPLTSLSPDDALGTVAHVIQTALTPVFLLNGIGTLLALFNTRLARVVDQFEHTNDLLKDDPGAEEAAKLERHYARLSRRVFTLDASVAFGAIGGAATCSSVFFLFLGGVRGSGVAGWLFGLFGLALGCTIASLVAFLVDSLLAWHGIRREGPLPPSLRSTRP